MIRAYTVEDLCEIQDRLNEYTVADWKNVREKEDFIVAILDEVGELLAAGRTWKWWKKNVSTPNPFEEKMEAVDIVHFHLSNMILNGDHHRFATKHVGFVDEIPSTPLIAEDGSWDRYELALTVKSILNLDSYYALQYLVKGLGMSAEEFSALYAAKSRLNEFRQDQGYKDGTYVKVRDGVEDVARLEHIVDTFLGDRSLDLEDVRQMTVDEFFDAV